MVLDRYREVDDFATNSLQLTSQFPSKGEHGATSRDHKIHFVLWIFTSTVHIGGKLRYPEPVGNFVCGGRIKLIGRRRQFETIRRG